MLRGMTCLAVVGRCLFCSGFAALSALSEAPSATAERAPTILLQPGQLVRRDLAGGQTHRFLMDAAKGDYVHVEVEQLDIDVVVSMFGPDGRNLIEMDNGLETRGSEEISLIAGTSGRHRIEVRAAEDQALPGAFVISVGVPRPARERDRDRAAADAAFAEGNALAAQTGQGTRRSALEPYRRALGLWRRLGDRHHEATAQFALGTLHALLSEQQQSLEACRQALEIWRATGNRPAQIVALWMLGGTEYVLRQLPAAISHYREALVLSREVRARSLEADVLTNLGMAYDAAGEKDKALEHYALALPLMRAERNESGEQRTLNNMGRVYDSMGEKQKALEAYWRALELARKLKREPGGALLESIGSLYADVGEVGTALDYLNQARDAFRAREDSWNEAVILRLIGQRYLAAGDPRKALESYREALPLWLTLEDLKKRGGLFEAIGEAQAALGDSDEALESLDRALSLARGVEDRAREASVLTRKGAVHVLRRESAHALSELKRALVLNLELKDRAGQARTLLEMARAERLEGDFPAALRDVEAALEIVESLRVGLSSHELRASFLGTAQSFYAFAIDLLFAMHEREPDRGFERTALEMSERARARGLLDLLTEARAEIRQGADPALLGRERALRRSIAYRVQERTQRRFDRASTRELPPDPAEIEALRKSYEELEREIRQTSPRYAALTQPQPLSARDIQRELSDDTLLLEYFLGDEASFLWAVTPTTVRSYRLPARAAFEEAARGLYALVTARGASSAPETAVERSARVAKAERELPVAAARLSRMLFSPVAAELGSRRLLIVGDGALNYVPFAALPSPGAGPGNGPLVLRHEIVTLPSASALAALRHEAAERPRAEKTLAILADPVFDEKDVRVRRPSARAQTPLEPDPTIREDGETLPAVKSTGAMADGRPPSRLPFTRREAEAILAIVNPEDRKAAFDFDANLAAATSPELSRFRFVHFATHGRLDTNQPELSGILLSLVDPEGLKQDGFLSAPDVFNLRLHADVVVLSACRTGLGKEIRGEGLVGLTRGFFYAGAARVLVSLWDVDDVATAALMERFYRGMLGPERLSPAAALRAAQLSVRKEKRWKSPYFWGAFFLQGEPR